MQDQKKFTHRPFKCLQKAGVVLLSTSFVMHNLNRGVHALIDCNQIVRLFEKFLSILYYINLKVIRIRKIILLCTPTTCLGLVETP